MGNNRRPVLHGKIGTYTNHKCQVREECPNFGTEEPTCPDAWAEYYRVRRGGSAPKARGSYGLAASTNNRTPGTTERNDLGFVKPGDDAVSKVLRELWGPAEDSYDRDSS